MDIEKKDIELIRCYEFKPNINQGKLNIIQDIIYPEYKRVAQILLDEHFHKYKITSIKPNNKDNKLYKTIKTTLSERYKDVINRQIVGIINSKITNFKTRFNKIVLSSDSFDDDTKKKLCFINKHNMYFYKGDYSSDNIEVSQDIINIAKWIFRKFFGKIPSCKNINMVLNHKVAQLEKSTDIDSEHYPYIIRLSTQNNGKLINLPLCRNTYFDSIKGQLKKSTEFVFKNGKLKYIKLSLNIGSEPVSDELKPISGNTLSIDIGITNLFGTDKGELLGNRFLRQLKRMDRNLILLQNKLKKEHGTYVKLTKFTEYTNLTRRIKEYTKNEINRILNLLYKRHLPEIINLEELDFSNTNLSKTTNRILRNFGLGVITKKMVMFKELGVKINYIDAAYTSQTCNSCGYVDKNNRKKQSEFKCLCCGLIQHGDINSTRTIDNFSKRFGNKIFYGKKGRNEKLQLIVGDFIKNNKFWMNNGSVIQTIKSNPYFESFLGENLIK